MEEMIDKDYKFKSKVTLDTAPYGVTHLSEIPRSCCSDFLQQVADVGSKKNWLHMVITDITKDDGWSTETLVRFVEDLRADLLAIKGKLKENNNG